MSNLNLTKNSNNYYGFSLLELLIVAVLGLLLLEIVWQSYLSAKKIYHAQNDLAYLSENMRFADFVLWQNIMQAGFAGCRKISELNLSNHTGMIVGIRGYSSTHLPDYLFDSDIIKGTDIIVIGKASADSTSILDNVKRGITSFLVEKNPTTEGNRFLLISDCKNADLFEAKNWGVKKVFSGVELSNFYTRTNAEVRLFEELIFFISNTDRMDEKKRPIHSLYFSINRHRKQELIADVTDMQVNYGVDSNGSYKYLKARDIIDHKLWDRVSDVVIDLKMHSNLLSKHKRLYIKLRERS